MNARCMWLGFFYSKNTLGQGVLVFANNSARVLLQYDEETRFKAGGLHLLT